MSIKSGRYIITNVQHRNIAVLPDANYDTPLEADHKQDIPNEEWKVTDIGNGRYSIVNFGYPMFASASFLAEANEHVTSNKKRSIWLIKRSATDENYTISTLNSKLAWWLDSNWPETPITLNAPRSSDARCLWTFKRIHSEDESDSTQAELEAIKERSERDIKAAKENATEAIRAAEAKAEQAIKLAEAKAEQAIRAAEEKELQATTLAKVEVEKREATEESVQRAIESAKAKAEEAVRLAEARAEQAIRAAEEKELQAIALAEREVERREAAEERGRQAIKLAEAMAEKAIRAAEARELQATTLVKVETEKREAAEESAQRATELVKEETARRKAAEEMAEKATILAQEEASKRKTAEDKVQQSMVVARPLPYRPPKGPKLQAIAPPAKVEPEILPIGPLHVAVDSIVNSAYKGLQIIEPWHRASSDHPTLSRLISDVRQLGSIYFNAIDASIQTAQDGYGFSGDAIQLCDFLLDPKTNDEDLREYIQDMKDKARHGWEECTQTLNKFRDVRKGLQEITKRFHEEVHEDDKTKLIIRVPAFGDEKKLERDTGLVDAMDELKLTVVNLGTLSEGINRFSQWWVEMETELKNAGAKGSGLRPGKDKGRVKQLRGIWSGFKEDYFQYKTRIVRLQDYYPSQIQASTRR